MSSSGVAQPSTARNRKASPAGSSSGSTASKTLLKLYSDDAEGFKVDPVVVMVMSLGFIFSVVALHVLAKITNKIF